MRKLSQVSSGLSAERPKPDSNARFSCSITAGIEVLKLLHDTVFTFPTFALDPPATLPFMLNDLRIKYCSCPPAVLATLLTHVEDEAALCIPIDSTHDDYADRQNRGAQETSPLRSLWLRVEDDANNTFLLPHFLTMRSLETLSISYRNLYLVEHFPSCLRSLDLQSISEPSRVEAAQLLDLLKRNEGSLSQLECLSLDALMGQDLSAIERICAERGIALDVLRLVRYAG